MCVFSQAEHSAGQTYYEGWIISTVMMDFSDISPMPQGILILMDMICLVVKEPLWRPCAMNYELISFVQNQDESNRRTMQNRTLMKKSLAE